MATMVFALLIQSTHAATTAANSTLERATWTPEPKGRGTWGILSNCIFTLIICIWTVIHDDVELLGGIESTPFSRLLSKLQWMLYAIMAPENVIASAYSQLKEAKELQKEFCTLIGVEKTGSDGDILGLEGSFLVVMGGFSYQGWRQSPASLDADGFIRLVKEKGVPDSINLGLIQDRSKADAVGKFLAVIQALSLVIQCLLRKIDGLTVTLLEFHVVIQVFCAILIYSFWWSKPQGVSQPIPFEQPATKFSPLSSFTRVNKGGKASYKEKGVGHSSAMDAQQTADVEQARGLLPGWGLGAPADAAWEDTIETSEIFQRPRNLSLFTWSTIKEIKYRLNDWYDRPGSAKLEDLYLLSRWGSSKFYFEASLYPLYGALHSIAWNSTFPSPVERLLWRLSCISLIVTPLCYAIIYRSFWRRTPGWLDNTMNMTFLPYIIICRSYLTIECFVSLRLLPANAYQTVLWERIWPHI